MTSTSTSKTAFTPLAPRLSAVDGCAQAIRRAILSGELTAGERLLPERRLAEAFAVNRVTVRGALARLTAEGLVTVRQGSGYRVENYRERGGPELVPGLAELAESAADVAELVADLFLVRRQLARAVLARIGERGSAEDVAAIEAQIEAFADAVAVDSSESTLFEADLNVLRTLLAATHSAVLQLCFNSVMNVMSRLPAMRAAMYATPTTNVAAYRLLLAALRQTSPPIDTIIALLEERDAATVARIATTEPAL